MSVRIVRFLFLLFFAAVAATGCNNPTPKKSLIEGQYELFNGLIPHSRSVVQIDIYADFTCAACQQFAIETMPSLAAKFGSRIQFRKHYLVGTKSPVFAQIFYEVADARGRGEEAAERLFKARLDHRDGAKNAPLIESLARDMNLASAYQSSLANPDNEARIRKAWNVEGSHITFFPSVVLENTLLTNGNRENLETIVSSLLQIPEASSAARDPAGTEDEQV
ncbi:putative DsbA family dithiol-disulfide isomerase [Luteibacter sp. Sphag1AF]|uniref:DsbA family protein n=1 Tax=Luteibacter sp. Sphag1AF TaxID=2587031 RepID=UPI00162193EB|nr:hypothetical protein [Luteibacter sp. Sphag1AF]MBB3226074.1 putative DsbA family dithiol-disulfide isomerase [Luteibacter sp. Sphag1AF]